MTDITDVLLTNLQQLCNASMSIWIKISETLMKYDNSECKNGSHLKQSHSCIISDGPINLAQPVLLCSCGQGQAVLFDVCFVVLETAGLHLLVKCCNIEGSILDMSNYCTSLR